MKIPRVLLKTHINGGRYKNKKKEILILILILIASSFVG